MADKIKLSEIKETYIGRESFTTSLGERSFKEKVSFRYKEVPYVDGWPRLGHFLLDRVLFYVFIFFIGIFGGVISALIGEAGFWDSPENELYINLITYLILYPGYYILFEYSLKSSPGKLILGRVVVNEYGEKPEFIQIVKRSYCRIVPFEFFSCLSEVGWHDTWSNTYVIRKKDLYELQLAIKAREFDVSPNHP